VLALLTHESSVVFLPVLFLLNWQICRLQTASARESSADLLAPPKPRSGEGGSGPRIFAPYVLLTTVYLALDLWINSRNYIVSEGHYTIGFHIVTNALNYIDALYVGRRDWLNYAVIAVGVVVLLVRGSARVRFATCWMLLALAPFLSFNWGNTSRYLYQPAIGFSLLLAEAVMQLNRPRYRPILAVLVAAIAIRFAAFANANVSDFAKRTQVYPQYLARFRQTHGDIPSYSVVEPDPDFAREHPHQFANAAVQWEYRDPTIQIRPYK
jgi:hypothetical protein